MLLQVGTLIRTQLADAAVDDGAGGVVWHGEAWTAATAAGAPGGLLPDGVHDLYSGVLGVALFLAAQARAGGDEQARDLALRALGPIRSRVRRAAQGERGAIASLGVGGLVGLGSLTYGLAVSGRLLEVPELTAEALALLPLLTPERFSSDREFDVGYGSAGALLALLSLEPRLSASAEGSRATLERAWLAAEHLLAQRTPAGDEPRVWASASAGLPRSGMAHGVAGICVALGRLWQRDGSQRLLDAVGEGLRFERQCFDEAEGNWLTTRTGERTSLLGWCQGAPGMALSRLALLEAGLPGALAALAREDLDRALAKLLTGPPYPLDHLCCGGMGWVEVLLRVWQHTGEPRLLARAHALARWVLRAAKTRGAFHLGSSLKSEPSLFQGLAGVGYAFLRLAEPQQLPCILLYE